MLALSAIRDALRADQPVLITGAPGTGKTASVAALATEEGAHLEVVIGSTMDSTDLGYLLPEKGKLRHAPPPWAERLREALHAKKPAWLFLDELSCVPQAMQAGLLRVVNERRVGDCNIAGCRVLAAANPVQQAAAGWEQSAASANRWLHLPWVPDLSEWADGMLSGWGQALAPERAAAGALVVSFVRARGPALLLAVPESEAAAGGAWPSPRTWDRLARMLSVQDLPPRAAAMSPVGTLVAEGLVGAGAATEWLTWVTSMDLPDPEEVLAQRVSLPDRGDRLAATLDACVAAALTDRPDRRARCGVLCDLIERQRPDIALPAVGALVRGLPEAERLALPSSVHALAQKLREVRA